MYTDPAQNERNLAEHYRAMSEEELGELAADFAHLTEMAQRVLDSELRSRGLDRQSASEMLSAPEPADANGAPPHEYTWKTQLCACADNETAWQIFEVLRRAGIESWIEGPGTYSPFGDLDARAPRVLVAADQLDEARAIAERPIPQEIIDESQRAVPEFETPRCPSCGACDPILEGVDPVNSWSCDSCGAEWTDAVENPQGKS